MELRRLWSVDIMDLIIGTGDIITMAGAAGKRPEIGYGPFLVELARKGFFVSAAHRMHPPFPMCRIREVTVLHDPWRRSPYVHARSLMCSVCRRYPRHDVDVLGKIIGRRLGNRTETGKALVCLTIDYWPPKSEKILDTELTLCL